MGARDAVSVNLKDIALERMEAREKEVGEDWPLIERLVLLRTIDSVWVEHLTEIDEMRQGIGWRGLAQEDPLNAFKKEAFALFSEMSQLIRHQVATTIFRVQIVRQQVPPQPTGVEGRGPAPAPAPAGGGPAVAGRALPKAMPQGVASGGSTGSGSAPGASGGAIRPGYSPAGVRMGRNEPCWCGSGVKYKKCHGR